MNTASWQEFFELAIALICLMIIEALIITYQPAQQMTFEQLKNYSLWMSAPFLLMAVIIKGAKWVLDFIASRFPNFGKPATPAAPTDTTPKQ